MSSREYGARRSVSRSGQCLHPDNLFQTTIEDIDDETIGVLEQWTDDAWIYAEIEDLRLTEPQELVDFRPDT